MLKKLSIIPIRMNGEEIHKDLNIHTTYPDKFRSTLENLHIGSDKSMAWIILENKDGTETSFLKKCDGKIINKEGIEMSLDELLPV